MALVLRCSRVSCVPPRTTRAPRSPAARIIHRASSAKRRAAPPRFNNHNHVYYTLADVRASASDAFARAPGRKETTAATLRVLGLEAVNGRAQSSPIFAR